MSHGGMNFVKGIGTGLAAGMVVTAVGVSMLKNKKNLKRSAGKAVRAFSDILGDVQHILK